MESPDVKRGITSTQLDTIESLARRRRRWMFWSNQFPMFALVIILPQAYFVWGEDKVNAATFIMLGIAAVFTLSYPFLRAPVHRLGAEMDAIFESLPVIPDESVQ